MERCNKIGFPTEVLMDIYVEKLEPYILPDISRYIILPYLEDEFEYHASRRVLCLENFSDDLTETDLEYEGKYYMRKIKADEEKHGRPRQLYTTMQNNNIGRRRRRQRKYNQSCLQS